ncbi:MAG: SusD/RagB family nutrient-binding outer membrane lipoprotein [Tannerellaceae bacterium]|jgi:hypothetical protein|nr:SusD/RagB family nutrient-binding outer membrane lipoprotein [Tannerellaceae bacterium]
MQYIYKLIVGFVVLSSFASCSKFDDINTNPDAATSSSAAMQATRLILNITRLGGNKYFVYDNMVSKQMAWGEDAQSEQYNLFSRTENFGGAGGFAILTNTIKMVELASDLDKEAYSGLAKFIKAYKLFYLSLEVGDIPYKEALQGEEGNLTPIYDTQKEVMLQILEDLDAAYIHFSAANSFAGDPIFNGNPEKWKKTVTAFQLKVLLNLSRKESDGNLRVKERFAQIVNRGPLLASNADNFQLVYADKANQVYPFNNTQTKHYVYAMLSTTLIDILKANEDYRLFYYAAPAEFKLDEGVPADSYDAYIGTDPSKSIEVIKALYNTGQFSCFNERYINYPAGEPLIRLGYGEQNFILAEAALRGWVSGDVSSYYKKGIESSFQFIQTYTPDDMVFHQGRKITNETIEHALNHPNVQLTGNFVGDLEKIMTQKYLASFMQYPWDAYFDYRRTGFPVLPINPETNRNEVKDKIPVRWMYPQVEYDYNSENVQEAVARQYGGVDDVNKLMWILQD